MFSLFHAAGITGTEPRKVTCIKTIAAGLAAVSAFAAALLWFISTQSKVPAGRRPSNPDGFQTQSICIGSGNNQYELVETLVRQSRWSRYAAIAAGLSAVCQVIVLYPVG